MQAPKIQFREYNALHNSKPERKAAPADQMWRNTLLQIPTVFGRLVFLASLRDSSSGMYSSEALDSLLGPQDADRAIRHSHHQVFSQWLAFSFSEQKQDIDEFLNDPGRQATASAWSSFLTYRELIPTSAREVERQLYFADLETLLELLKAEYAGVFSAPEV
jgi:hypothetical protein